MNEMSISPPKFLFATVGLEKGSGGMAELSRQVFTTLLEMHRENSIHLEVHILEGVKPETDELFQDNDLPEMHWYVGNRWKFVFNIQFSKPDIQLYDHVGIARFAGLIPSSFARPYLLLIHGIEIWNTNRTDYLLTARKADLLIANSEYTAHKVRAHCPKLPEIRVCWPGRDMPVPVEKEVDQYDLGPHAILIVGRLCAEQRHKGHDLLLEAMSKILLSVPDAKLVIAGGGDDSERLEMKAEELHISNQVVFTGWVDEDQLSGLYSDSAVFAMPSEGDGFGIVFLEAMMHSLPCVGLRTGAAAEIFEHAKNGILVDERDLAIHLVDLLLDIPKRSQLGAAGHERYQGNFRARHHNDRMQSVLKECLN